MDDESFHGELESGENVKEETETEEAPPIKVSIVPEPVVKEKEKILDDYSPEELEITKEMQEDEDYE